MQNKEKVKRNKVILCVDDEKLMLAALSRILRKFSYEVVTCDNGEEAIKIAASRFLDLIILDLWMPGKNGFEVLEEIRKQGNEQVPVVFLTGDVSKDNLLKGYDKGCQYYISKPFNPDYVTNIVEYLIGDLPEEERQKLEIKL